MTLLGISITTSVIVSVITSTLVSGLVFMVGVRIGKEKADRNSLRELYKLIFAHLQDLKKWFEDGRARHWGDYYQDGRYDPPIQKLTKDGQINLLPKHIAAACIDVEKNMLSAGGKFHDHVEKNIIPVFQELATTLVDNPPQPVSGKRYMTIQISSLVLNKPKPIEEAIKYLETDPDLGFQIELSMRSGRTVPIYIYKDKLKSGDVKGALEAFGNLSPDDKETDLIVSELRKNAAALTVLLNSVANRIKDPHPFRETIMASLRDVFQRE